MDIIIERALNTAGTEYDCILEHISQYGTDRFLKEKYPNNRKL